MSDDLYLIAHKVRGEPAFDIATQVTCAECQGQVDDDYIACSECDSLGFWWVVPTSGHRAYPFCTLSFEQLGIHLLGNGNWAWIEPDTSKGYTGFIGIMPDGLPDHYTTRASPARQSLASLLAIPRSQLKVDRRF